MFAECIQIIAKYNRSIINQFRQSKDKFLGCFQFIIRFFFILIVPFLHIALNNLRYGFCKRQLYFLSNFLL